MWSLAWALMCSRLSEEKRQIESRRDELFSIRKEKKYKKIRRSKELLNAIGLRECRVYLRPKGSDRGRGVAPLSFKAQS